MGSGSTPNLGIALHQPCHVMQARGAGTKQAPGQGANTILMLSDPSVLSRAFGPAGLARLSEHLGPALAIAALARLQRVCRLRALRPLHRLEGRLPVRPEPKALSFSGLGACGDWIHVPENPCGTRWGQTSKCNLVISDCSHLPGRAWHVAAETAY